MSEIEVICDNIENKNTENKDIENNNIENKDIENKDIENKNIENKNIENKNTIPRAGNNNIIQIDKKPIKKLTNNEKDIIINNAKNGIENKYYDVLMFKNGNSRIIKKKYKGSDSIVSEDKHISNITNPTSKILSNDQFLIEHIIELNNKFERLKNKQKKLKSKYRRMKYDIYDIIDSEDVNIESEPVGSDTYKSTPHVVNNIRKNWRSMVTYL